jgi:hypothetical protein
MLPVERQLKPGERQSGSRSLSGPKGASAARHPKWSFAFSIHDPLIRFHRAEGLHSAIRPPNFHPVYLTCLSQAEVQAESPMTLVTPPADYLRYTL